MAQYLRPATTGFSDDGLTLPELSHSLNPSGPTGSERYAQETDHINFPRYYDYEPGAPHDPNHQPNREPLEKRHPLLWPEFEHPQWTVQVSYLQLSTIYAFILLLVSGIVALFVIAPQNPTIIDVSPHFHTGMSANATSMCACPTSSSSIPTLTNSMGGRSKTLPAPTTATTTFSGDSSTASSAASSTTSSKTSEMNTQAPSIVFETTTPKSGTVTSIVLITSIVPASRPVVTLTTDVTASPSLVQPKPPERPIESKRSIGLAEGKPRAPFVVVLRHLRFL